MLRKTLIFFFSAVLALLAFSESYTITFKVFNSKTYAPIKGAEIYLKDKLLGKTDDNGILKYEFEVGDYDITVKAPGFKPETRTVSVILDSDEEFYLIPSQKVKKKVKLGEYKRKYAILVGVSQTADKNIPRLQFADSDVDRMRDILITYFATPPENIFVLKSHPNPDKGENKSTKNIFLGVLDKIIKLNLSPDDLLIIYMSTHGETTPDESGEEPDGYDEVFAMSDSKLGFMSTFLFDDELSEKLKKIHAKKGLIFDACYIAGRKGMVIQTEEEQEDDLLESSDFMITSSAPGAASYESKDLGSSMFMAAFEKTVEDFKNLDENSDGYVDSSEFFDGLKKNLEVLSNKYLGFTQTPTLEAKNVIPLMNIKVATLNIKVSPKGAVVYLDGSKVGEVKDKLMVSVKVGYHSLEVSKEGYQKFEKTIKIHPGMNELLVKLVKEGGWFTGKVVDSQTKEPIPGAKLIVIGSDNLIETDENGRFEVILPKGSYSGVIIKKPGYEILKYNKPIVIKGQKIFKVFEMKRVAASSEESEEGSSEKIGTFLSVRSNLTGAMVFLDDRYIGKTPIEDFPVDPGNYNLKVTSSTGEIIKKQITVMSGKKNPVFVEFSKIPTVKKEPENPEIIKTVRIMINTIPSGANVTYIKDGQTHQGGLTPLALKLPEGWYSFVIEKEGYEPVKIDEDYYLAGDEVEFNINLTNIKARSYFKEALKAHGKRKIELLEKAYSLDNYDKDIAIELVKAYMSYSTKDQNGEVVHPYTGKAMVLLNELLSTMKDDPTVHLYAGIIYFNSFDYDSARKEWKKALDLSPSMVQAYYYLYKSYKIDPFIFGKKKKELMRRYALGFVSMVKYLKLEKSYEKELSEIYRDFPDLKEWGK